LKRNHNEASTARPVWIPACAGMTGRLVVLLLLFGNLAFFHTTSSFAAQLGGQAGAFSRIGLGADRAAMGDVGAALTGAGMNWYYNPAGVAWHTTRQASLGYRWMALDRKMMFVGLAAPLKGYAAVAFGYVRAQTDNIDARDSNGNRFDILSNSDNLIHGTFSVMPNRRFSLGVSLKWFFNAVPDILDNSKNLYSYGMGIDIGTRFLATDQLALGLQIRDIGAKYSCDATDVWNDGVGSKDDLFPTLVRAGAALEFTDNLTMAADFVVNSGDIGKSSDAYDLHFGGEWRTAIDHNKSAILRAGWNGEAPTFGLGFDFVLRHGIKARVDYGYIMENRAPSGSHLIGWTFNLD